jgi:hypothetical protein
MVVPLFAQSQCEIPIPAIQPRGQTILTQEQEGYAGEFFDSQIRRTLPIYQRPEISEPLDRISKRLLQYLPPSSYQFQFTLIELSFPNAFAIPGGRIYVSRRLIATVESEDELAGVLAHEMGHVLARQASVDLTKQLRDTLKVTSLGDRADVQAKMNALLDAPSKGNRSRNQDEDDQLEADRISSAATWRAGYDPAGLPRFLDRISDNKGETGNFFSDFFGATKPETKRYREMLKSSSNIPASCRQSRGSEDEAAFREWKKKVTDLAPEDLVSTLSTRTPLTRLAPALRPEINNIKFSPDGQYLLAQEESGITILQREPLQVLFRIPALDAGSAIFLNDSQSVMFRAGGERIETWSIPKRARTARADLPINPECQDVILSPDGKTFACMSSYNRTARLMEIGTGTIIASHSVPELTDIYGLAFLLLGGRYAYGAFAPDGSAFLLSTTVSGSPWAYSIAERKELSIGQPFKSIQKGYFAFLDPGRVAALAPDPKESGVFSFPAGKQLDKFTIPEVRLYPVTKGDVVLIRPMADFAVGALSIADRQLFLGSPKPAMDRYGDIAAAERSGGEIALYQGRSAQAVTSLQLPDADLSRPRSIAHSADLQWIAISNAGRGQVWNLKTGETASIYPFDDASFGADGLILTLEEREQKPGQPTAKRVFYRTIFNFENGKQALHQKVEKPEGSFTYFSGPYKLYGWTNREKKRDTLEVTDTRGVLLWTRQFNNGPRLRTGNVLVLEFSATSKDAAEILKSRPALRSSDSKPRSVLEAVDLASGRILGDVVLDDNWSAGRVNVAGRTLFVEDNNNRTLAYSLDSGERIGQQFGRVLAVDPVRGRVAATNQLGAVVVSDSSLKTIVSFEYPRNVIHAGFDASGTRLIVVTGAQDVFIETLPE